VFEANRDQELISSDRLNSPGSTQVNWVVNAWNSAALDVLDYQWSVAVPFWQDIDKLAADHDVTVALELHPQNLVFNTADVFKY